MARNDSAAGTAGKLLRIPVYGLGALAAMLIPRSDRVWVFGSETGPGGGALALYRMARARLGPRPKLIWLAGTRAEAAEARGLGLVVRRRHSPRGLWATLRARTVFITHGFADVNRYAIGRALLVQLWHGIPLLRLHLDSPEALRLGPLPDHARVRAVVENVYRRNGRRIGLFPVPSAVAAERIVSAFGITPDRVIVTGDPRHDVLFDSEPERSERARARIEEVAGPLPADSRVVLYAPHWREESTDPGLPSDDEWDALAAWAERTDSVLLIRVHPHAATSYAPGAARSDRFRLLPPDRLRDLTSALPAVDVLITDYAAAVFDYSLLERPIVFFAPDVETFAKQRGLYESYRDVSGGRRRSDWAAVIDELDSFATDPAAAEAAAAHSRWLRDEHLDVLDGTAAGRIFNAVMRALATARGEQTAEVRPPRMRSRPTVIDPELLSHHDTADGIPALVFGLDVGPLDVTGVALEGGRARVAGDVGDADETGRRRIRIPLVVGRWGAAPAPLPSGDYRLILDTPGPATSRLVLDRPSASLLTDDDFHAEARPVGGEIRVRISAPLDAFESGPRAQRALERAYRDVRGFPEDAVLFESYYSQSAADNPLGIDRALARLRPEVKRYWSVVDLSLPVPSGAVPVVEGTREWWRLRAAARVIVVNDWLRRGFRRRPHQKVLQTWHGTMFRRLALDRPHPTGFFAGLEAGRARASILLERRRWDVLVAQNEYSAEVFRSAYSMDGPIWVDGYPRNDVLHAGGRDARVRAVRERLGAADDTRIVLYAPAWRDDRQEMVDLLDVERFAARLGPGHLLVVRGHARTVSYGRDVVGPGLIDATGYPQPAELLLVADALITDYSAAMFDWMSLDRPIIFHAPDLDEYTNGGRDVYFDLAAEAPGPVFDDPDEVLAELRTALDDPAAWAERYREKRSAWRSRFAALDDGRAGERVVGRMIDAGWFD